MNWNRHSDLEGTHAFLSASKYHWLNYSDEKMAENYTNFIAAQKGSELHSFAASCIRLGQKLPKKQLTLNMYVNDAISYKMTPEQVLYYSPNCYGTADSISFRNGKLRIHDYKSGITPAKMEQLMIYAGLFFLEYKLQPEKVDTELRIYQFDQAFCHTPSPDEILPVMDKIVRFDKIISKIKDREGLIYGI